MDIQNVVQNVINTLNQIEVSGAKNLSYLLGCIHALENVQKTVANADSGASESEGGEE